MHERFHQPAIAEEFIDGRELYVSVVGNGDDLEILPITEMVFDKRKTRPEERIATKSAKWDEDYRARKGIRNVFARPIAAGVRERIESICRTAFRALWLRDYARLDVRLAADGEVWFLEANANPFISYGHDMANAAEKAGHGLLRLRRSGWWTRRWRGMSARRRPARAGPGPELRCVCGQRLQKYWNHCPNCARELHVARRRQRHRRGVLQLRLDRLRQVLVLSLVRRRHLRGGLLQRDAAEGAEGLPDGRALRLGLRRRRAVSDGQLPLVRPGPALGRGRTSSRATVPTAAAAWTTG